MKLPNNSSHLLRFSRFASAPAAAEPEEIAATTAICAAARSRLLAVPGDPFLDACWEPAVFFHYRIDPEVLRPILPKIFELELHEGRAALSLAAVRMTKFRARRICSTALVFQCLGEQRFLNLRLYGKCHGEPGALFLHGWLSPPRALPMRSGVLGLSYTIAQLRYEHDGEAVSGVVKRKSGGPGFSYRAFCVSDQKYQTCSSGSLAEFAMERYTGFVLRRGHPCVFRVWHPPWLQIPVKGAIDDCSLVTEKFPWFSRAEFAGANLTATINDVWMGNAHRLRDCGGAGQGRDSMRSAFLDMP